SYITSFMLDWLSWKSLFSGPVVTFLQRPVSTHFFWLRRAPAVSLCRDALLCRLRRPQPIEAETVTPIGEAVDTTEHRRYCTQARSGFDRNHLVRTRRTSRSGEAPGGDGRRPRRAGVP